MTNINLLLGLRVLVVGLGREGTALAVYLAKHSIQVTATDKQSAPQLDGKLALLQNAGVLCVLGEHPLSL